MDMAHRDGGDQQAELARAIVAIYSDAVVKKIDVDTFLDIHLPAINAKRGTHLFFRTGPKDIKIGFYCRDEAFVGRALEDRSIERYGSGVRPMGNPGFVTVSDAIAAAIAFLSGLVGVVTKNQAQPETAVAPEQPEGDSPRLRSKEASGDSTDVECVRVTQLPGEFIEAAAPLADTSDGRDERIAQLSRMLAKAFGYAESDPDTFLQSARRATEAICRFLYQKEIGDLRPKLMLNDLGRELVLKKVIPERTGILIGTIQTYGNYGAHAQDDFSEVTREWVAPCRTALASLTNWFFIDYLQDRLPVDVAASVGSRQTSRSHPRRADR